jgi:hypothetical protein
MKCWLAHFIFLFIIIGSAHQPGAQENQFEAETKKKPQAETTVAPEDVQEMMIYAELFEIMELLEDINFFQEVDLFMEGDTNEKEE